MSRRALVALFIGVLLPMLVATLPLRLAIAGGAGDVLDRLGLTATQAPGTVWSGQLRAAAWRGRPQGDIAVSLRPLSLLAGIQRLRLSAPAFSVDLLQGRRAGFEHASGQLELPVRAPLPGTLVLSLDDAALVFGNGTCQRASGRVAANFTAEGLPRPLRLAGPLACDGERGRILLSTQAGPGAAPIEASVTIDAHGRYEVHSLVRSTDGSSSLVLQAAGFRPTPEGLVRTDRGRFTR